MASCTASSAICRWAGPTSCAKCDTMRPAWRRKVCSSSEPAADSLPEEFSNFDGAMFEVRMIERARHGLLVIGGLDHVEAPQDFFGFAIRAVGRARLATRGAEHFPGILGKPLLGLHKSLC